MPVRRFSLASKTYANQSRARCSLGRGRAGRAVVGASAVPERRNLKQLAPFVTDAPATRGGTPRAAASLTEGCAWPSSRRYHSIVGLDGAASALPCSVHRPASPTPVCRAARTLHAVSSANGGGAALSRWTLNRRE